MKSKGSEKEEERTEIYLDRYKLVQKIRQTVIFKILMGSCDQLSKITKVLWPSFSFFSFLFFFLSTKL